jgi:aminomethyltransferase
MAIGTPFHPRTAALCASHAWRRWSGHLAASSYGDFVAPEYAAIRNATAMIDVSPLYKYTIAGRDAAALLDRVVTHDVGKLQPGQALYTPWCDRLGHVRQDGTVFRLDRERFLLNAAEPAIAWLHESARGLDVEISDQSRTLAALALQGPTSRDLLCSLARAPESVATLGFFRLVETTLAGVPVTISRTGYTGDLGYEVWVAAERALELWDALIGAGPRFGLAPSGLFALDIARLEAGFVLIGVDYVSAETARCAADRMSPWALGLGWAVKLDKGPFEGRAALLAERTNGGPPSKVVGLEVPWEPIEQLYLGGEGVMPDLPLLASRDPVPVYDLASGRHIGRATTRVWSTLLKKYIALATLESAFAPPGSEVGVEMTVRWRRQTVPARVVKTPFFRPERTRA